jgi:outer membrane protein assembly factor BamA
MIKRFLNRVSRLSVLMLFCSLHATMSFALPPQTDSTQSKRSGWAGYPLVFYTPETKTGGGGAVSFFFREAGSGANARPSSLLPVLVYTQKQQISGSVFADLYWRQEQYHVTSMISYAKWPNLFYGIGNYTTEADKEDYTQQVFALDLSLQRRARRGMYIGAQYQFLRSKLVEVEAGGRLARAGIAGTDEGTASGIGALVSWDTRDNIFNAASGSFYQLSARTFHKRLHSDFDFTNYVVDLRQYFPLNASHVVAVQGYVNIIHGEPPFYLLSQLGGQNIMRGYYQGRYRDKNMLAVQMEYRLPVWKRIGAAGFAGIGEVAPEINAFKLQNLKPSVGMGLRYLLVPAEKINLRMDFGWGKDSSGFYLAMTEAF